MKRTENIRVTIESIDPTFFGGEILMIVFHNSILEN